jgi:hypothetical protein
MSRAIITRNIGGAGSMPYPAVLPMKEKASVTACSSTGSQMNLSRGGYR